MAGIPRLRVVPLENIRPHEEVDPLRVDRLATRIEAEGMVVNPVVCTEDHDGNVVLLDGATRTESLKRLDLTYGVVQLVDPNDVHLETWHHVVRDVAPGEVVASVESNPELTLVDNEGPPRITTPDGQVSTVYGEGVSHYSALAALVASYVGKWRVNRVIDPSLDNVAWRYPDWAALIEFPALTINDVINNVSGSDSRRLRVAISLPRNT